MKIMISQPMHGKTEKEIEDERAELVKKIEENGDEVIDTIIKDFDCRKSPIAYLAKSIEFLDQSDGIVFMQGWEKARGCIIEHEVALRYNKWIKEL